MTSVCASGTDVFSGNRSESKRASENSTRSRAPSWPAGFGALSARLRGPNRRASIGSASSSPRFEVGPSSSAAASSALARSSSGVSVADGSDDHSAGRGARLATTRIDLILPVGGPVALEIEQAFERIEHRVAAAAADPPLGDLELILDDSKRGSARDAARRQTHREIMPRGCRPSGSRRAGSSLRPGRRRQGRATASRRRGALRPGARARPRARARRARRPAPRAPAPGG